MAGRARPPVSQDELLKNVVDAVEKLFDKQAQNLKFVDVNSNVFKLVKDSNGQSRLLDSMKGCFQRRATALCAKVAGFTTLSSIIEPWREYDFVTKTPIPAILNFMDDINKKTGPSFYQMGLIALAEHMFMQRVIFDRLRPLLWRLVSEVRDGSPPDHSLHPILHLLLSISNASHPKNDQRPFYEEYFESQMLAEARAHYSPLVGLWIDEGQTTADYLELAASQVAQEMENARTFMPDTSKIKLKEALEATLMDAQDFDGLRGLLMRPQGGMPVLLKQIKEDEPTSDEARTAMRNIATIFTHSRCRHDCIAIMVSILKLEYEAEAHLHTSNPELKNTTKASYIDKLLKVKAKYELIVHDAFRDDKKVKEDMDQVFPSIIKKLQPDDVASALACHYNILIAKDKVSKANERDAKLQEAICVLQYMTEKDLFENYHRKHMKRRLLMSESSDDQLEAEATVLLLIKNHYDTSTMEMMFQDYRRATGERATWSTYAEALPQPLSLSFRPLVLNTARWGQEPLGLLLPPTLQQCVDVFTSWFSSIHPSRKLNWIPMGVSEVNYKCGRAYRLSIDTTPQLILLLQFESANSLTTEAIAASAGTSIEQVHRFLAPFASKQIAILNKTSDGYTINPKFKFAKSIVKIPMGARATAAEDKQKTAAEIQEQRKNLTHAAMVRIMKANKSLHHSDLNARTAAELSKRGFMPEAKYIKKAIDFLIQEGFIKRSEAANDVFEYLA